MSNQKDKIRCGDNGIFKGVPVTEEQQILTETAKSIYAKFPYDGKYVLDETKLVICQSNAETKDIDAMLTDTDRSVIINPLGEWTGGIDVDSGATNRKLGSDMGDGVTGGGLHGKDFSKADVSVNLYCHIMAQSCGQPVTTSCAIGDEVLNFRVGDATIAPIPYSTVVANAKNYIRDLGGFEKFAEWGLF